MRKIGRMILIVTVIAALLLMLEGVYAQAGHCCSGECCPICPVIERVLSVLNGMAPEAASVCAMLFCAAVLRIKKTDGKERTARTLVTMKCELLD